MSKIFTGTAIAGTGEQEEERGLQQKNCEWRWERTSKVSEEGENDELLECHCRNQKGNLSQKMSK